MLLNWRISHLLSFCRQIGTKSISYKKHWRDSATSNFLWVTILFVNTTKIFFHFSELPKIKIKLLCEQSRSLGMLSNGPNSLNEMLLSHNVLLFLPSEKKWEHYFRNLSVFTESVYEHREKQRREEMERAETKQSANVTW